MINQLLDESTIKNLNLKEDDSYTLETKKAIELLNPRRLDVIAKYLYLLFKDNNIKSNLANEVYKEHIGIFSDGEFYEPGSKTKTSYDSFLEEFDELYSDIKKNGFDASKSLIPIGKDNVIINGGHRTAISMYLDKEVSLLRINKCNGPHYDYVYFQKNAMKSDHLDFLVYNYIKITNKPVFAICLWPKAVEMNKTAKCEELISKKTNIIYRKRIGLNKFGLKSYMMQLYKNEKWLGEEKNNYMGAYAKLDPCYAKEDTIIYFVEAKDLKTILELKKEIRNIYNIGKHSVHITDTKEEAETAANLVLTKYGVFSLNNGRPNQINNTIRIIEKDQNCSNKNVLNPLYTLKYFGYEIDEPKKKSAPIKSYEKDLQYDTNNFFYYRGMKFISPDYAKELCGAKYSKQFDKILNLNKVPIKATIKEETTIIKYMTRRTAKKILKNTGLLNVAIKIREKL